MLKFLKQASNKTFTENGAMTPATTNSDCLDLFATIGALRREGDREIIIRFDRAYAENPDLAMKTLFFARDIRGGLGERRVFRTIIKHLAEAEASSVRKNIEFVAEYGRYDDMLVLLDSPCRNDVLAFIGRQFEADVRALDSKEEAVSLLGKWLPSVNASNIETIKKAKVIARYLGISDKVYRQTLTRLRSEIAIIENKLRQRDYSFDYEKQPSRAMFKYRKAFQRNDGQRYGAFLERVNRGEARLKTAALLPYEIITSLFKDEVTEDERKSIDATWRSLESFTDGKNTLAVIDGSGSMYSDDKPIPAAVALSLGIYFAEHNTGAFKGHFITFSETPQLVEVKGHDILEKLRYCCTFNEVANTDLQKVFELILGAAVQNKLGQKDMPEMIYIISDMEFDSCTCNSETTNFLKAKNMFRVHGYKLPVVVFWNVASRNRQQPVTMNEQGVLLVSGASPRVFSMIGTDNLSPYSFMMETLSAERYAMISA